MPAPKRSPSADRKSAPAAKSATKAAGTAKSGATKAAGTAKSGATKAAGTAKSRATKAAASTKSGTTRPAAAKPARSGAGKTATATRAKGTASATEPSKGPITSRELVMLTRDRIQETLDDAAARGRVTRQDANDLVTELVRRGRAQSDDLMGEIEQLLERGREQLESATKLALKVEPVDRIVRGADRARRSVGVGSAFPILGYEELNVGQVQSRLGDLSKPELRKVLSYERKHANRKTVVGALEKAIG